MNTPSVWLRARKLLLIVGLSAGLVFSLGADESLSITEFGVGTDVVERELKGKAEVFAEGKKVWFWTRVVGGTAGDRVRHVWLRGEEEMASVELNVGGSHWRTYSNKMMHPGSVGDWVVEARDGQNRVLARASFRCE